MSGADRSYRLHHLSIALRAPPGHEEAARRIEARLAALAPSDGAPDLVFAIAASGAAPPPPLHARRVYEPPVGAVLYDEASDRLHVAHGPGLALVAEPAPGRATAWLSRDADQELVHALSHPLFTLALVEAAKRRGLFALHAGGVARGGRAVLLAGGSGAGKSTLTLALVRAGWDFLGDDTLFLARGATSPAILSFPDEVDLADRSLELFPEAAGAALPCRPGARKRSLRAERVYRTRVVAEAAPALLLFPSVAGRVETTIAPLDRATALLELLPNVLLTDPSSSQAHLDALGELVAASACWRVATGTDLHAAVRVLEALAQREWDV